MGEDEIPFFRGNSVQFGNECVGGETLVLLSDAGLQQQIKLEPGQGLYQQFWCPLMRDGTFLRGSHGESRLQPLREADGVAELVDLYLVQFHRHLDPALPAALLSVIDRRVSE